MKRFIAVLLCFVTMLSLFSACGKSGRTENEPELFFMRVFDDEKLKKSITDVYIPHKTFILLSRVVYADDITGFLKFPSIEKVEQGSYVFRTELRKFVLTFDSDGQLTDMLNIGNRCISKREFKKIKAGDSFKSVAEIDPSAILWEKWPPLLGEPLLTEPPNSEHILSDGSIGLVEYKRIDGDYVVESTVIFRKEIDTNLLKALAKGANL